MAVGDVISGANLATTYILGGPNSASMVFDATAPTSGYTATVKMDDTGLSIRHNSASRDIRLGVNSGTNFAIDSGGDVGIGTASPAASANPEFANTVRAFLVQRMTTTQRDALTAVDGMIIYNTTTSKLQVYASGWVDLH